MWRFMMEYFLIAQWRECQRLLDTYDVVGAPAMMQYWTHESI